MLDLTKALDQNLQLTIMLREHKSSLQKKAQFYLVGILPVQIEWKKGQKKEVVELYDRVAIEYFENIKELAGEKRHKDYLKDKLQKEWVHELIIKMKQHIEKIQKEKKLRGREFYSIEF